MGSNRGKWGAIGALDRDLKFTAFHSLLPDSWGTGEMHPKQTMTLAEIAGKVNEEP